MNIKNESFIYTNVFILSDKKDYDFILEEGDYCTYTYAGKQNRSPLIFENMKQWICNNQYVMDGPFLEFLLIDVHETKNVEEYVTSIHVKIKSKS